MILTVHVKPSAKKDSFEWIDNDTAKIQVRAVAEKGKANKAVIELIADTLNIPKYKIKIIRGTTTRMKQIEVINL